MVQHNKTALVTGASRGIGRATALALADTGAHILVHYGRSPKRPSLSFRASSRKAAARTRYGLISERRRCNSTGKGSSLHRQ